MFNTYQTYLKSSLNWCQRDMDRSRREGWAFGAKVVRGAYMVSERQRAKDLGIESPISDSYEDTEKNFHNILGQILKRKAKGGAAEVMVASHNQDSVRFVVGEMQRLGIRPEDGVYFGQLLGMADHLTFTLGRHGYKSYKYIPYGPIGEVIPYLIRRTQENSSILGSPGVQKERAMVRREIRRRLFGR